MDAAQALASNFGKAKKDPKVIAAMNRDLGVFHVVAVDTSTSVSANLAYRSGWMAGYLFALGTPVNASAADDGDDGADDAPDHPLSPAVARDMGVG